MTEIKQEQPEPIIGIDLGTTNSLVAWCDEAGPRILPGQDGEPMLPSVVRLDDQSAAEAPPRVVAIGVEARQHAVEYPHATIYSVKRLMGRGMADMEQDLAFLPYEVVEGPHDTARVKVGEQVLAPQQISAMILAALRDRAAAALGRPVRKAVITVPAYFDDAQRQATRDAGRIAGLEVVRIVNEPTAAALAYNIGQTHGKQASASTVAVFDLGGGTFDVSILRLEHTPSGIVDQVLATAGDTRLGGDDVDRMLVELIQKEMQERFGRDLVFGPATRQAMRNFAEAAKIRLSNEPSTTVEIDLGTGLDGEPRVYRRTLTREAFDTMIESWVERTLDMCRLALKAASLEAGDIDRVILVGGSTRIPAVRQAVGGFFGSEPYTALDPDQVVALGAAVQASILMGINRDVLLLDVVPLSLGIETMGGAVAKLIVANTTIPCRATEKFSTYVDGQTSVKIHVLQGERELAADCRSLGQFDLRGVPPMPAGLPKIEVVFLVDANGILNVSAIERRSEKSASIQIVPNHGLTRDEVDRMERDSYAHAKEDMTAHRLIDLRNQARMDIRAIERQIAKVGSELEAGYVADIEARVAKVKALAEAPQPDADALHQALDGMDKATVPLAEAAIRKTLQEEQGG